MAPRMILRPLALLAVVSLTLTGCDLGSYRRPAYSAKKVSGTIRDFRDLALDSENYPDGAGLTRAATRILQKWRPSEAEKKDILSGLESETADLTKSGEPVAAGRMKEFTMIVTGYAGAPALPRREWEYRP